MNDAPKTLDAMTARERAEAFWAHVIGGTPLPLAPGTPDANRRAAGAMAMVAVTAAVNGSL